MAFNYKQYYNKDLCKRFISDMNLPIPVCNDAETFFYYLSYYEKWFQAKTLWIDMCKEIANKFNGDIKAFLENYYTVRDSVIHFILNNPQYKEFINTDICKGKYVCEDFKRTPKGNVYNGKYKDKWFISIDLKEANFQALRHFSKEIVKKTDSYKDFISTFTDSDYIKRSRYFRQVVFGKLCVSRQMTIEKYLLSFFYERLIQMDKVKDKPITLVRVNNDEILFEINEAYPKNYRVDEIVDPIKDACNELMRTTGIKVNVDRFQIVGFALYSYVLEKYRDMWFAKVYRNKPEFKTVPLAYDIIVRKLWQGESLTINDYYINYEGLDAYIHDSFNLEIFTEETNYEGI